MVSECEPRIVYWQNLVLTESMLRMWKNGARISGLGNGTVLSGIVRPLDELPKDIKRWLKRLKASFTLRETGLYKVSSSFSEIFHAL